MGLVEQVPDVDEDSLKTVLDQELTGLLAGFIGENGAIDLSLLLNADIDKLIC